MARVDKTWMERAWLRQAVVDLLSGLDPQDLLVVRETQIEPRDGKRWHSVWVVGRNGTRAAKVNVSCGGWSRSEVLQVVREQLANPERWAQ